MRMRANAAETSSEPDAPNGYPILSGSSTRSLIVPFTMLT
jgi:hypothetical protein